MRLFPTSCFSNIHKTTPKTATVKYTLSWLFSCVEHSTYDYCDWTHSKSAYFHTNSGQFWIFFFRLHFKLCRSVKFWNRTKLFAAKLHFRCAVSMLGGSIILSIAQVEFDFSTCTEKLLLFSHFSTYVHITYINGFPRSWCFC